MEKENIETEITDITTMSLPRETMNKLVDLKLHRREPIYEVIERLIKFKFTKTSLRKK